MRKNSWINKSIIILITLGVLYFSLKDNGENILESILQSNFFLLFIAIFLYFVYSLLQTLAFKLLIDQYKKLGFKKVLHQIWVSIFLNAVTPFASGSQPMQIYMLNKSGINLSNSTTLVLQNSFLYQVALILIGIIAVSINKIYPFLSENSSLKNFIALGFLANTIAVTIFFLFSFSPRITEKIVKFLIKLSNKIKIIKNSKELLDKIEEESGKFGTSGQMIKKNWGLSLNIVLINLLSLVILYCIPYLVIKAIDPFSNMNILFATCVSAYIYLIGAFVPIPGGSGGMEGAFIILFGSFQTLTLKSGVLPACMLLWRIIIYYLPMIIGMIMFTLYKKEDKS